MAAEKKVAFSYDDLRRVLALGLDRFGRVDVPLANAGDRQRTDLSGPSSAAGASRRRR